eukprot:TRINITY_DN4172_c0_g1_i1.p3 TRINITY_DN4172_c0_g1~~TRINITY_DN4172_c0_g1_i1.p3  ORF type:complete len:128 (-),score=0.25 TRINITY_DN4172_c0_g1_i1:9-392(-)
MRRPCSSPPQRQWVAAAITKNSGTSDISPLPPSADTTPTPSASCCPQHQRGTEGNGDSRPRVTRRSGDEEAARRFAVVVDKHHRCRPPSLSQPPGSERLRRVRVVVWAAIDFAVFPFCAPHRLGRVS